MILEPVLFHVTGYPAPKGSMKCIGKRGKVKHQLVEDVRVGQRNWRNRVVRAAAATGVTAGPGQPVSVDVTFTLDRPASHRGTGRNRDIVKAKAPTYPTGQSTNDLDKMVRLIGDALQEAELLVDDAQVVDWRARKRYVDGPDPGPMKIPGALIRVRPIGLPDHEV